MKLTVAVNLFSETPNSAVQSKLSPIHPAAISLGSGLDRSASIAPAKRSSKSVNISLVSPDQ